MSSTIAEIQSSFSNHFFATKVTLGIAGVVGLIAIGVFCSPLIFGMGTITLAGITTVVGGGVIGGVGISVIALGVNHRYQICYSNKEILRIKKEICTLDCCWVDFVKTKDPNGFIICILDFLDNDEIKKVWQKKPAGNSTIQNDDVIYRASPDQNVMYYIKGCLIRDVNLLVVSTQANKLSYVIAVAQLLKQFSNDRDSSEETIILTEETKDRLIAHFKSVSETTLLSNLEAVVSAFGLFSNTMKSRFFRLGIYLTEDNPPQLVKEKP